MNLLNVISEQFCSSSTCLLVQDCERQAVRKPGHCLHQEERPCTFLILILIRSSENQLWQVCAPPDSPLGRCVKCIKTHDAATWLMWDIISTSASFHTCFITDRTVRLQEVRVGLFHSTKDIYLPCTVKTAFYWIYTVTTTRFFPPLPLPCSLIRCYYENARNRITSNNSDLKKKSSYLQTLTVSHVISSPNETITVTLWKRGQKLLKVPQWGVCESFDSFRSQILEVASILLRLLQQPEVQTIPQLRWNLSPPLSSSPALPKHPLIIIWAPH